MTSHFGGATRKSGGGLSRFVSFAPHADQRQAALPASHAAVIEGRTLFPTRVVEASDAPRLLVAGFNSAKIGGKITKGPWSGLPVYTLTLEERATCPRSCHCWDTCYGNSMPMPRRHRDDGTLTARLGVEVLALLQQHRRGIAVRLHVLGDFPTADYARAWLAWTKHYPTLHVFGFTAWQPGTEIGQLVLGGNKRFSGRWCIRCSVPAGAAHGRWQATTIWRQPESANVPEGLVCPASTHKTAACSTCGLCWSPAADDKRIVFVGHGRSTIRHPKADNQVVRKIAFAGGATAVARGMGFGIDAIKRWAKNDHVPAASMEAFEALCDDLGRRKSEGIMPAKAATPQAVRQCENLAIEPTDDDFRQAVADIAWTQANPTDHRASFVHPDPGSRETWRVYLGGSEVDVLFQPSSKVIVGVAMVRGYAKCSARKGRMPAPRVLEPASNPARSVAAPPAPKRRNLAGDGAEQPSQNAGAEREQVRS